MTPSARLCLFVCLVCLVCLPATGQAQGSRPQQFQPGFRTVGIWNPDSGIRMDVAVWYPSLRPPKEMRIDGWSVLISRNGREVPGRYPIILISHGAGSSRMAVHDLAAAFARQGFLVIAPTHPGDNASDTAYLYHARLFQERPRHLALALEAVLSNPDLAPLADETRIGLLGVGSGAATVLQLTGAAPDISALPAYCAQEQSAAPLCTEWARQHHSVILQEYATALATQGAASFTPSLIFFAAPEVPLKTATDNDAATGSDDDEETKMPSPVPAPVRTLPAPAVPRRPASNRTIKAVGLMTPGLIGLFPDEVLRAITLPVAILDAANDALYSLENNGQRLLQILPSRPALRTLEDAGHYMLQAPCPPVFADTFAALCSDQDERDKKALQRNVFFIRFFQKELGGPLPPLPPPPTPDPQKRMAVRAPRSANGNATLPAVEATRNATVRQHNGTRTGNGTARATERAPARRGTSTRR